MIGAWRSGVGDTQDVLSALSSVLTGKTAVKTESSATFDATPRASQTALALGAMALVAVVVFTVGRPRPRRRRR